MLERKQLFKHRPEEKIYGDCHRTAIACLLNIEPNEVPHFYQQWIDDPTDANGNDTWERREQNYLNSHDLHPIAVIYPGDMRLEELFDFMHARNPKLLYLLGGQTDRGFDHTVICCGGGFRWDPHPDGTFLNGPMSHGFWEVTFFTPVSFTESLTVDREA